MSRIEHIIEPSRVWLVWQPNASITPRTRRVVGEITYTSNGTGTVFRYLVGTRDFTEAQMEGFEGFPAFKLTATEHTHGVLEAFMRRLPPRKREDFNEYLARHRLPDDFKFSDMALLAYTGAKLPGDGFEFCADLDEATPPFELVIEIAGFRHQSAVQASDLVIGDEITISPEPTNTWDCNAIALYHRMNRIGYIDRAHTAAFHHWRSKGFVVTAKVERINGKPERPLIYLFITVKA